MFSKLQGDLRVGFKFLIEFEGELGFLEQKAVGFLLLYESRSWGEFNWMFKWKFKTWGEKSYCFKKEKV